MAETSITAAQRLSDFIRQEGGRQTPERFAVLEVALTLKGHFTAEELSEAVDHGPTPIARSTVFATADLLVRAHILQARVLGGKRVFEKAVDSHHHTVCNVCGRIKDLRDKHLDNFLNRRSYSAFTPDRFELTITGTCSACARKRKKSIPINKTVKKQ